jgi:hypothetical protein
MTHDPTTTPYPAAGMDANAPPEAHPDAECDPWVDATTPCGWTLLMAWAWLQTLPDGDADAMEAKLRDARARRSAMTPAERMRDAAERRAYLAEHQAEWDEQDAAMRASAAAPLGLPEDAGWATILAAHEADVARRAALPPRRALDWVDPDLLDAMGIDLTPTLRVVK